MSIKRAMLLLWGSALAFCVFADQLTVSGTVTDSVTGNPISGAIVTLRMGSGFGAGGRSFLDTTGSDGSYSITVANNTDTTGRVSVAATGYMQNFMGRTIRIPNPSDGTADNVTANIQLRPLGVNPTDTSRITIVALVVDSSNNNAPLSGATVTVTAFGGTAPRTVTATTGADGRILLNEAWGSTVIGATATATKTGYTTRTVTAQLRNDTINFGTIRLLQTVVGDTFTYRFTGRVTDGANGVGNAIVTVTMTSGGAQVYTGVDTTTATGGQRGAFSLQTRQPYAANQSVTLTVSLDGFAAFDTTFVPVPGTNTLNIVLRSTGVIAPRAADMAQPAPIAGNVFQINGRCTGSLSLLRQSCIVRAVRLQAGVQKSLIVR